MARSMRIGRLLLAAGLICGDWCAVWAQPRSAPRGRRARTNIQQQIQQAAQGTTDASRVREFWQRYDRVHSELTERHVAPPMFLAGDRRVAAIVDKAHVGLFFTEDGPTRYFALHLQVANESAEPILIPRERIQAVIAGDTLPTQEITSRLANHGFGYGAEYFTLEQCQPAKELRVPAGGVAETWLVYGGLPVTQTLADCQLALQAGDRALRVPVNAVQRALLELRIEPLGPRRALALITVGGQMNTFNMYSLVDDVEALTAQKVGRIVVQWRKDTPLPDSQLMSWLQNSALGAGTGRTVSEQLPALPSAVREMHLVQPNNGAFLSPEYTTRPQAPPRVHASDADAVAAALRTTILGLSREELLAEIREGHRLSRAAALIHGAPRLDASDLPLVLDLSQSDDAAVRRAALHALGDFDQPSALARLEDELRQGGETDLPAAVAALSESRYRACRDRFANILATGEPALVQRLASVLAQRPQAEWADVFAKHARDERGRLQPDMIRALVHLDDPRLLDLLIPTLRSDDRSMQDLAFQILAERSDERAERAASDYVLERLREGRPDALQMTFLNRSKDARAVPLLLKHLEDRSDRTSLINLLGQIGDVPVGDALLQHYNRLQTSEQVAALNAIRQLRHPQFVELAGAALSSPQDVLVSHAIQGLSQVGGPDVERLLCDALAKATKPQHLANLAMAVANLGTTAARQALQQARTSDLRARRDAALVGLQQLRQNSPGYASFEQGRMHAGREDWPAALEAYKLAGQLDPQLAEAFAGQGDIHLKQNRPPDAEQAFGKAYALDSTSGLACSGLAVAQVLQGRLDEGLNTVEKVRGQFADDVNYSYNVACVYGRAAEAIAKQPPSAERDAKLASFQKQAIDDLRQAVKLKFDDFDWMRKDPDLKSLHDLPGFRELSRDPDER
jgi:Flp pilus assembly protein TadD